MSRTSTSGTHIILSLPDPVRSLTHHRFYNRTPHSGLETHITNSYTNALLQLLHYTLPIRRAATAHIATACPREHCLFCELGFLTKMLNDARGTNCQSTNFCRTVEVLAQSEYAS